ncbi:hypothetical protein HOO54_03090 [Bacillus sp. WMMC1349]|uniref:hypothetical protein n=1 Tax=Bacillus sp. WMMC1349 TaxID=2736254 RepID=UPI001551B3F5|nr:hypothetical protein [Bacillus sp. WMMC1349]NPC91263.1 hypothetical protein [Bacillus sp. WMMC1349]
MEIVKSLLFIVYGVLLHVYSKDSASKLQRHVYNFFILATFVGLITYRFFPYWKVVVTLSFVAATFFAIKTMNEKIKTGEFIAPPIWILLAAIVVPCLGFIMMPPLESTLLTVVLGVFLFSCFIVLEKANKKHA